MSGYDFDLPAAVGRRATPVARLAGVIRRHPLVAVFVLAYAFSWSTSLVYLFTRSGPTIVSCGPAIAAFTVLAVTGGRRGVKGLLRSMVDWRVGYRRWAIALSIPLVLSGVATGLNLAFGAASPSSNDVGRWTNVLPTALIILLIPVIGGAWEEPGWRGYALPRLLARSPLAASLVLGVLWAAWHLPVYFVGDQHWSDLVLVVVGTIVFTWVFQLAGGSVLVAMVVHALNNAVSGEYFSQMFDGADSTRQSWMLVVTWSVAALLVVCFSTTFRRRLA
jgi:membrane protease YdiL (CAAX protease family)